MSLDRLQAMLSIENALKMGRLVPVKNEPPKIIFSPRTAEQDPILPGRTSIKLPADYPPDLYWKGQPPKEEYNYVLVDVKPGEKTKFTLNRFRPWSAESFGTVELFK